jgi:hypothetical protein
MSLLLVFCLSPPIVGAVLAIGFAQFGLHFPDPSHDLNSSSSLTEPGRIFSWNRSTLVYCLCHLCLVASALFPAFFCNSDVLVVWKFWVLVALFRWGVAIEFGRWGKFRYLLASSVFLRLFPGGGAWTKPVTLLTSLIILLQKSGGVEGRSSLRKDIVGLGILEALISSIDLQSVIFWHFLALYFSNCLQKANKLFFVEHSVFLLCKWFGSENVARLSPSQKRWMGIVLGFMIIIGEGGLTVLMFASPKLCLLLAFCLHTGLILLKTGPVSFQISCMYGLSVVLFGKSEISVISVLWVAFRIGYSFKIALCIGDGFESPYDVRAFHHGNNATVRVLVEKKEVDSINFFSNAHDSSFEEFIGLTPSDLDQELIRIGLNSNVVVADVHGRPFGRKELCPKKRRWGHYTNPDKVDYLRIIIDRMAISFSVPKSHITTLFISRAPRFGTGRRSVWLHRGLKLLRKFEIVSEGLSDYVHNSCAVERSLKEGIGSSLCECEFSIGDGLREGMNLLDPYVFL